MNTFEQIYVFGSIVIFLFLVFVFFYMIIENGKIPKFPKFNFKKKKKRKPHNKEFIYHTSFVNKIVNDLHYDTTSFIPPLKTRRESFLFLKELDNFLNETKNLALSKGLSSLLTYEECQEIMNIHINNCIFYDDICALKKIVLTSVDLLIDLSINHDIINLDAFTPTAKKLYLEIMNGKLQQQHGIFSKKGPPNFDIENLDHLIFIELEKYNNE